LNDFPSDLARALCGIQNTGGDDTFFVGPWIDEHDVLGVLVTTKVFDGAFELLNDFTTNQWNLWLASCGSNDSWKQANNNAKLQDPTLFVHLNACKMYAFPKKKNAFCRAICDTCKQTMTKGEINRDKGEGSYNSGKSGSVGLEH
jgi:hypothetical protein